MTDCRSRPFTREQAVGADLSDAKLRNRRRFTRLLRGVYVAADVELSLAVWLRAALLVSPAGAVVSHVSALRWYGFETGPPLPLHVSTRAAVRTRHDEVVTHRRRDRIASRALHGIPVTDPDRTLIDVAYDLPAPRLIEAIEWMLHRGLTTFDSLAARASEQHLRGVRRIRSLMAFVREGSESPMETRVRLMLRFAHLPEATPNVNLYDDTGRFIARGDLVHAQFMVLVEYDGWHHERDARQRQRDIVRRERIERAGWTVIVVTAGDLRHPRQIVLRVHRALVDGGYRGPAPTFSVTWDRWFAPLGQFRTADDVPGVRN